MMYFSADEVATIRALYQNDPNVDRMIEVLNTALERILHKAVEESLLHIPEVVSKLMAYKETFSAVRGSFLKQYPDLKDHTDAVLARLPEYQTNYPGEDATTILNRIAVDVRKELRTHKLVEQITDETTTQPTKPSQAEKVSIVRSLHDPDA